MVSVYRVSLQNGKTVSPADFPDGVVLSIERTGPDIIQVVVQGNCAEVEKALRSLKQSIRFYQRVDAA